MNLGSQDCQGHVTPTGDAHNFRDRIYFVATITDSSILESREITKMSGKITCYLDCGMPCLSLEHCWVQRHMLIAHRIVSPYSYFALLHLERTRSVLEAHNIEIECVSLVAPRRNYLDSTTLNMTNGIMPLPKASTWLTSF